MLLDIDHLQTWFRLPQGQIARAVDGISFTVDAGEIVALVGESGCGKSATAYSLMRLLPENAFHPGGHLRFEGRDLLQLSDAEMQTLRGNRMAMIFQEPMTSLNPVMRVGKQLLEPLLLHQGLNPPAAAKEAVALLRRVGIPDPEARFQQYPHQLSGGMKQRIMIAMALACKPRLLIADEPTTALDVTIQAQILGLMKDLQAETGTAILFITHDLGIVNQLADRVCVMYAGKIAEAGTREQIFRNMAHPYTRALFRSLPQGRAKERFLYSIPGQVPAATAPLAGCPFHDRCSWCFDRCRIEESALHQLSPGHTAACHLLEHRPDLPPEPAVILQEAGLPNPLPAAAALTPLLEVRDLRTHFQVRRGLFSRNSIQIKAVDGVSFTLPECSTLALVGESGCGKTTVGLSLLRLLREARGRIIFQNSDVMQWNRSVLRKMRRQMQIVFQDPYAALSPRLTVAEIIGEGLRVHCPQQPRQEQLDRIRQSLMEVGMDESAMTRYPHEFSGGQRQRISLARALVLEPAFLVLDEPTSALDVSVQAQILNLLLRLQRAHRFSCLFISHNLAVVEYLADFVAVMYLGRIIEYCEAGAFFRDPRHPYSRSLLEAVPKLGERHPFIRLAGEVPSLMDPPAGCHFHPRCPVYGSAAADSFLQRLCPFQYPELLGSEGHLTSCHAVAGHAPGEKTGPPHSPSSQET